MSTNYNLRVKLIQPQNNSTYRYYLCLIDLPKGDYSNSFSQGTQSESTLSYNFSGVLPTDAATLTYALPIFTNQVGNQVELTEVQLNYNDADGKPKVIGGSLSNLRPPVVQMTESFLPGYIVIPSASFPDNQFILLMVNTSSPGNGYDGKFLNVFNPTFDADREAICCGLTYDSNKQKAVAAVGIMPTSANQYAAVYVRYQSDDSGNDFNESILLPVNYPVVPL